MTRLRGVIFDLDGLAIDSETTFISAWMLASEQLGFSLSPDFCRSLSGLHRHDVQHQLIAHCGDGFDLAAFDRLSASFWRDHVQQYGIALKPGLKSLLKCLRQLSLPYCLATNSVCKSALDCLRYAGLDNVFGLIVSRDDVVAGKPAPDIFLRAIEAMDLERRSCLVLEDSLTGVQAAYAAGIPCAYIPSQSPPNPVAVDLADWVFDDLSAVADFIRLQCSNPV